MSLSFYDYSYIEYPLVTPRYAFLEFKNDRLIIDVIKAITLTLSNNVFLSFHNENNLRHICCEKLKDLRNEEIAYLLNLRDGHYRAPFEITKTYHPFNMFYTTCKNCVGTGVLDWIGAASNKFKGYCCKSEDTYDDLMKNNRCFHFHRSNKYVAHIVEMQIVLKKLNYENHVFQQGLSRIEIDFLRLLGINLTLLEKYKLNYLDAEEIFKIENQMSGSAEIAKLLASATSEEKHFILPAITFVKKVDVDLIDPDLYKICPFCNGTGIKFIDQTSFIEEPHYRIRSIPSYEVGCEDVGGMLSLMNIFYRCKSAREFIFQINHMMRWEGNIYTNDTTGTDS